MTLSISKLQELLYKKGFNIKNYFTINNVCIYIEVHSTISGDNFFIYIPSKYVFKLYQDSNVFEISYIDIDEKYLNSIETKEKNIYQNLETFLIPDRENDHNIDDYLESNYNKPIDIEQLSNENIYDCNHIYKQIKRLRNCVKNTKYDIGILYKNFLVSIRHNDIEFYYIKNMMKISSKKLFIIVNLEIIYNRGESLEQDINTIRKGIYNIISNNFNLHSIHIRKLLENKEYMPTITDNLQLKKIECEQHITKFEKLLKKLNKSERKIYTKIDRVETQYNYKNKNLYTDIEKTQIKNKYIQDLNDIKIIKEEIVYNLLELKERLDNILLTVDNVLFENIITLEKFNNNFKRMEKILSYNY